MLDSIFFFFARVLIAVGIACCPGQNTLLYSFATCVSLCLVDWDHSSQSSSLEHEASARTRTVLCWLDVCTGRNIG